MSDVHFSSRGKRGAFVVHVACEWRARAPTFGFIEAVRFGPASSILRQVRFFAAFGHPERQNTPLAFPSDRSEQQQSIRHARGRREAGH